MAMPRRSEQYDTYQIATMTAFRAIARQLTTDRNARPIRHQSRRRPGRSTSIASASVTTAASFRHRNVHNVAANASTIAHGQGRCSSSGRCVIAPSADSNDGRSQSLKNCGLIERRTATGDLSVSASRSTE